VFFIIFQYKKESEKGEIKSLGQFANALTRYELSQEDIKDILSNLEQLTGTDFDEAQVSFVVCLFLFFFLMNKFKFFISTQ